MNYKHEKSDKTNSKQIYDFKCIVRSELLQNCIVSLELTSYAEYENEESVTFSHCVQNSVYSTFEHF